MQTVIANPVAGRGRAKEAAARIEEHCKAQGTPCRLIFTQSPGHATQLAKAAVEEGASAVWSLGGDGTLHEVAEGLLGSQVPLGILPCGTGNDLARTLGIPAGDAVAALTAQDPTRIRVIDLWTANGRVFTNVAGTGFDCQTLLHTRRFKRLPGSMLPYLAGLFFTLFTHKNTQASAYLDGAEFKGPFLMVTLANGRFFGGGMQVAPQADPRDGLLDVVLIEGQPRPRIPFLLPKFFTARHVELACTRIVRAAEVVVRAQEPIWFEYDGELFQDQEIHIRKSPHSLVCMALTKDDAPGTI